MLFFTADHHFGHANIIKHCKRPFANVDEMNDSLVVAWNLKVGPKDTVYHLGDFCMGDPALYRSRLNGKIILLRGNHDHRTRNLDAHFQEVCDVKLLKHDGHELWLSHYAHRVWPKKHYGTWHLFGHSHGGLPPLRDGSIDVGVDTSWSYAPYSWQEVKDLLTPDEGFDPGTARITNFLGQLDR